MTCLRQLIVCAVICIASAAVTRQLYWQRHDGRNVTTHQAMTSVLSAMMCVGECMRHSQCDSCAYDRESGTCYVQVETDKTTDSTGHSIEVYTASSCREADAPINYATTSVKWRMTGMELEGEQICNEDSMFVGNSPTLRCSGNGNWSKHGKCCQKIWRNVKPPPAANLALPRDPVPGWTVCLNGTPTAPIRFSVDFVQDNNTIIFTLDSRLNITFDSHPNYPYVDTFAMASRLDGVLTNYKEAKNIRPFPVVFNQSFEMKIKAINLFDVQVYVDDTLYINYTLTKSLVNVTRFRTYGDVDLRAIDLWCDSHTYPQ